MVVYHERPASSVGTSSDKLTHILHILYMHLDVVSTENCSELQHTSNVYRGEIDMVQIFKSVPV